MEFNIETESRALSMLLFIRMIKVRYCKIVNGLTEHAIWMWCKNIIHDDYYNKIKICEYFVKEKSLQWLKKHHEIEIITENMISVNKFEYIFFLERRE